MLSAENANPLHLNPLPEGQHRRMPVHTRAVLLNQNETAT